MRQDHPSYRAARQPDDVLLRVTPPGEVSYMGVPPDDAYLPPPPPSADARRLIDGLVAAIADVRYSYPVPAAWQRRVNDLMLDYHRLVDEEGQT